MSQGHLKISPGTYIIYPRDGSLKIGPGTHMYASCWKLTFAVFNALEALGCIHGRPDRILSLTNSLNTLSSQRVSLHKHSLHILYVYEEYCKNPVVHTHSDWLPIRGFTKCCALNTLYTRY